MSKSIDESLLEAMGKNRRDLEAILNDEDATIADIAAAKIVIDALEKGGKAMDLLVERTGGKAVQRNLSVSASVEEANAFALSRLLGGDPKEMITDGR